MSRLYGVYDNVCVGLVLVCPLAHPTSHQWSPGFQVTLGCNLCMKKGPGDVRPHVRRDHHKTESERRGESDL
jgi:hypothetical protein